MEKAYLKGVMDSSLEYMGAMINSFDWEDSAPIGTVFNRFKDAYDAYMYANENNQKLLPMSAITATVTHETKASGKDFNTEDTEAAKKSNRGGRPKKDLDPLNLPPAFFDEYSTLQDAIKAIIKTYNVSSHQLRQLASIGNLTWAEIMNGKSTLTKLNYDRLVKNIYIPERFLVLKTQHKKEVPPLEEKPQSGHKTGEGLLNDDGSDPSHDVEWINQRKQENRERLKA